MRGEGRKKEPPKRGRDDDGEVNTSRKKQKCWLLCETLLRCKRPFRAKEDGGKWVVSSIFAQLTRSVTCQKKRAAATELGEVYLWND